MKKLKLNLGPGGIQALLAQHVEKIVLAVVGVLVALFLYSGYTQEGYTKNPAELHSKALSAQSHVGQDTSLTLITSQQRDRKELYRERVQQSLRPTAPQEYGILPFNPLMFPPTQPRQDPELFAPLMVEAEGFLVAVHELVEDAEDAYAKDKNAGPVKKAAAPKKTDDKKTDKKKGDATMPMMGPPGEGGKGGKGGKGKPAMPMAGMPGGSGMPGGAGMPGGSGMPGKTGDDDGGMMGGMQGNPMQGGASVSEAYMQKYVHGYRASGGNMGGMAIGMTGPRAVPVSRYVIAVKAVIPHEKLVDEYRRVFAEAQGYDPFRDTPRYVYYNIERAEVGDDPAAELEWHAIRVKQAKDRDMQNWAGVMREIADARYVDPAITQPMPPAMMVDPVRFGLHAEVPRASQANAAAEEGVDGKKKAKRPQKADADGEDAPDLAAAGPFAGGPGGAGPMAGMPGMAGGAGGMPGMAGGAAGGAAGKAGKAGGMPGMAGGAGGMPGMAGGAGGMPGMAGGAGGMPGMAGGMPGMGGGMPGMGGGMDAMGGGGMPGMSYGAVAEAVKYKLVRFYDFDVEPGKKYRYRVRVWIEDPNHPQSTDAAPSPKILAVKVAERVKALDDKEREDSRRVYYRITEWSEASPVAQLPAPVKFVAGHVRQGRMTELREQRISVPQEEPSATLLPIVWDVNRAVDVPGFADAPDDPKSKTDKEKPSTYRGSILNFHKDARILRPDTLEMKRIEKYAFRTNAVVVDMRPSEPLRDGDRRTGDRKDPLMSSGEILILDGDGNLIVRSELDDVENYRKYMFVGEEKDSSTAGPGGMMPGGGGGLEGAGPEAMMPGNFGDILGGPGKGKGGKNK